MPRTSRARLATVVRRRDCDLAEAALLCCLEVEPETGVEVELLRLDALADGMLTRGFARGGPDRDAAALADYLGATLGFDGTEVRGDPGDGLLTRVLDRRRGHPTALTIVYVAVARRLGLPAFPVRLPGAVVTGVGTGPATVVLDPAARGAVLDDDALERRVRAATAGRLGFRRAMLRPADPATVIRRLLDDLTDDFTRAGDAEDALWTVELKQLLPNARPEDHRVRGRILERLGRFLEAAAAYEAWLGEAPSADEALEARHDALRVRAALN